MGPVCQSARFQDRRQHTANTARRRVGSQLREPRRDPNSDQLRLWLYLVNPVMKRGSSTTDAEYIEFQTVYGSDMMTGRS
jgi:hypothetical protein